MVRRAIAPILVACLCGASNAELIEIDSGWVHSIGKPGGPPTVVYFVTNDCPISNRLMPEIDRICEQYASADARCLLAYVDPSLTPDGIRQHEEAFGITQPTVLDSDHRLVNLAGASVTPEAALFDRDGELAYRGRINNLYAALGTPRRRPTEHDLRDALDEVVNGRKVSQPRTQAVGCFIPRDWQRRNEDK